MPLPIPIDWERYAARQPHTEAAYAPEPVQVDRIATIPQRCIGTVLDVGSSDGYSSSLIAREHPTTVCDISHRRVERAQVHHGLPGVQADAAALPFPDDAFDTVVLGEILEHLENPGPALAEACRVARQRVVVTVPLNGWEDPTHQWRIKLDLFHDPDAAPTKTLQLAMTWDRAPCWPPGYWVEDERYRALFLRSETP